MMELFPQEFIRFFKELQRGVGEIAYGHEDELGEFNRVLAVDAAYSREKIAVACVVYDLSLDDFIEEETYFSDVAFPYVPGLLFLREGPYMLEAVSRVRSSWDLMLVDAHGRAHPRKAGMATFLGLCVRRPTVGVAKRLLAGVVEGPILPESRITLEGETVGYAFHIGGKRFYVSQGYGVRVEDIPRIVKRFGGYPKPLDYVDKLSKRLMRELGP